MSKTIDHRIVEMRFDNKQFEAGAKQTMSTLTRLKEALKLPNTAKALEGIDKATKDIRLDGIAAGVEVLEKRFSTLGIVGMRVIENITDGLMGKLNSAVNFVTNSIVSGGIKRAMNIENAHFQLQALLKDETKVQAVMADAMESVDGTAYAYDEAARAASQFAASGVQSGEEMLGALKGITGVAAMTNSSFEDISNIFTTVAGNGRLMGDQLLQLSSRGLNAASTLVDYFKEVRGQAGITEGEVREMVSKGKISFKDFSDAMTWAFGESAKRANETFTGALSNMKSALARIGAGFISPLVEQNGEMVNLFNALRIKINDVKSALVFDEQRSAVAGLTEESELLNDTYGKMLRNGTISIDTFVESMFKANNAEDVFGKKTEKVKTILSEFSETGNLTTDMLKDLNRFGTRSSDALREYINGVQKGTIQASDEMKEQISNLSNGMVVLNSDIKKWTEEGKINYEMFTNAMSSWTRSTLDNAGAVETVLKGMFSEVKKEGHLTTDTLEEFSNNGMDATEAILRYMNGVKDGSIRASYATRSAIEEMTDGVNVNHKNLNKWLEEGAISYDIFQSAMENAYGTEKTLSKQVTDTVLDGLKGLVTWINDLDMTKPMEIFYYGVETIKNGAKGLYSVLAPVGKAFSEVFLGFSGSDIVNFAAAIERVTSKLRLSEKGSKNLHDAFKGLFDIGKLVADILFSVAKALFSINKPLGATGDGFLGLIGFLGRGISDLISWIRSLTLLRKAFGLFTGGIIMAMDGLSRLINIGKTFIWQISQLEGMNKFINSINNAFTKLGKMAAPYVNDFVNELEQMIKQLLFVGDFNFDGILENISDAFSRFADKLDNFTVSSPAELISKMVDKMKSKLKELYDFAMSNEGFSSFVNNFIQFAEDLRQALTFDNIFDRVDKIMEIFGKFFNWIKETIGPALAGFNAGSVVAAGGGIGLIYAFIKASKAFENISKSIKSIPDLLGSFKNTLQAYQRDLNASAILKIAAAIGVLAGALVLLSFADPERLLAASAALSLIAGTLLLGVTKLLDAMNKGKELNAAMSIFAKGLSSTMKKFGRAMEIRAVGAAVKNFAKSVAIIAASIIALGLMYRKDKEALMAGVDLVKMISISMVGIMAAMSILGNLLKGGGMKQFSKAALGVLMLAGSLTLVVNALSDLFKLEFPPDWEFKLKILAGIFAGLAGLSIVLALASRIAGKGQIAAATVAAFATLLVTTVFALDKLFKMEFPPDWQEKITVLGLIFAAIGALMITIGVASRLAGGTIKAAGTILAMSIFIGVIVAALMILTTIPTDKLIKGATALGIVLGTLGMALYGAGQIVTKDAPKAILGMAIMVGAITAALAILATIPAKLLLKGAIALGSILLVLAADFKSVSKISDEVAWAVVFAMVASIAEIAYSLFILSERPWKGLLAASVSLGGVLLSLAKSMEIISKAKGIDLNKISLFGLATMALIPIGVALYALSKQPWDGMISSALSISSVLLAFAGVLKIISNLDGLNVKKIGEFLLATVSLAPIGAALYFLADKDWASLLAGGIALSTVITAMSVAFSIISRANPDLKAMATFLLASASVSLIALSLTELASQPWESLLSAGASLSAVLLSMTAAMAICAAIGPIGLEAIAGIAVLDLFAVNFLGLLGVFGEISKSEDAKALLSGGVETFGLIGQAIGAFVGGIAEGVLTGISSALPQIGSDLSEFMKNLEGFISQTPNINEEVLKGVGILAACIIAITAAEVISGIGFFLGGAAGLVDMALNLVLFINTLEPFLDAVKGIDAESMQAVKSLAQMILILTAADMLNGIGQFLGISGSLGDFGSQLAEFGPYIRDFSETVKDVKPEAVEGAAAAGEIMATLANKLPGSGGILQQFFGEKNLAEFGAQMLLFGGFIVPFSEMVKDVNPDDVKGAAAAAEIMAVLADKLPPQGGFTQTIFGEKNLADFGAQLTAFGEAVVPFAEKVAGVNPFAVTGVSILTAIMTSLANDLPDTQSLWGRIFGGNKSSLSAFGNEIELFGISMANFSSTVSGINYEQINKTIDEFKNLVAFAQSVDESTASTITGFVNGLGNIGSSALDTFVDAFAKGTSKIGRIISDMIANIVSEIRSKSSQFTKSGQDSATFWTNGIMSKSALVLSTGIALAQNTINGIKSKDPEFQKTGQNSVKAFITGLKSMYDEVMKAGDYMAKGAVKGFKSVEEEFVKSGQNAIRGFIDAVNSQMSTISNLGKQIGDSTVKSAQKSLDEHSPSKRMGQIGDYAGIGFIKALVPYVQKAYDAGEEIGNAVYDGSSSAIQLVREMSDPVIKPSVDLDGVKKSMDEINTMFNDYVKDMKFDLNLVGTSIDERRNGSFGKAEKEVVNNITNNYNMKQENYSPKALSTVDIYRNTENQFSRLKQSLNDK